MAHQELVGAVATRYREADQAAVAAQTAFRRNSNGAAWLVVLAATASAVIMVAGGFAPDTADGTATGGSWRALNIGLAILGLAFAGAATALMRITQGEQLLEKWMVHP